MVVASRRGFGAFVVALVAVILVASVPGHRELDWEGTLIPSASKRFGIGRLPHSSNATTDSGGAKDTLAGTVVLISGATSGIGFSLTKTLSGLGARVVALARSPEKLAQLRKEIPSVSTFRADFSDLESVSKAADEIVDSLERLDVLINNAGMVDPTNDLWGTSDAVKSRQGFDTVFSVNYLSHFLLTEKVSRLLGNSSKPTIVQISSLYHFLSDGSDLRVVAENQPPLASRPGGRPGFDCIRRVRSYANSKLAQILHARSLRRKHPILSEAPHIRIVSVCPAWVATKIAGQEGSVGHRLLDTFAFPADGWGLASILLATLADDENRENDFFTNVGKLSHSTLAQLASGSSRLGLRAPFAVASVQSLIFAQRFLADARPARSSQESYDDVLADGLYDWSMEAVGSYV